MDEIEEIAEFMRPYIEATQADPECAARGC